MLEALHKPPKLPGTYFIVDENNEKIYVGSTGNLRSRFAEHSYGLNNGKHENVNLQNHYEHVKGKLKFIYAVTPRKELAITIEQLWLDGLNDTGLLCNIATNAKKPGLNTSPSSETREKISQTRLGSNHSDESKQLMSLVVKQRYSDNPDRVLRLSQSSKESWTDERKEHYSKMKSKPIVAEGIKFVTTKEALKVLEIASTTLYRRINSDNYPDYFRPV